MVIRYAVITLSDKAYRGQREDTAGPLARRMVSEALGGTCVAETLLPDERSRIEAELIRLCDTERCHLVVTTGGTGLSPRDVTPEATRAVLEREAPGLSEAMRAAGMRRTPRAMLSCGVCGLRGHTLIVNCSGSPRAVQEQLDTILPVLPHALSIAAGEASECARPNSAVRSEK
jgi:molybdenum cofactor synthesis domain-containing protein